MFKISNFSINKKKKGKKKLFIMLLIMILSSCLDLSK